MKQLEHQFSENQLLTTSTHGTQSSKLVRYSDPIPVDLLIDIFSRVPGKSTARFRCLSKFWASILCRPYFTELFLNNSLTRPRLFFTIKVGGKLFFYSTPQPQNPNENSSLIVTPYHTSFPKYFPKYYDYCIPLCGLVFVSSCHNEMRRRRRKKMQVICCNPATGKFLTLPQVLLKEKNLPKEKARSNPTKIVRIYFGYDPIGKQFKVLCMTTSNTHHVLTLETGKRLWRRIERKFQFRRNSRITGAICINGVLYFGAVVGLSSMLVCFDVRSEKFSLINTIEDMSIVDYSRGYCFSLFNYKGKLGIQNKKRSRASRETDIVFWVLEDAENHKWSSKHIYLSPLGNEIVERHIFVGMTGTGEIVLSPYSNHTNPFYVFFYNLERNTFTRVNIQGFEEFNNNRNFVATFLDYVENMKLV